MDCRIPIVLVVNCSQHWKHVREYNFNKWQDYIYMWEHKYNFIQFGLSKNIHLFDGTTKLLDMPIREELIYFDYIKNYIGIDTGEMHMMISLGHNTVAFVPDNSTSYNHALWHFNNIKNVKYISFDKFDYYCDKDILL